MLHMLKVELSFYSRVVPDRRSVSSQRRRDWWEVEKIIETRFRVLLFIFIFFYIGLGQLRLLNYLSVLFYN